MTSLDPEGFLKIEPSLTKVRLPGVSVLLENSTRAQNSPPIPQAARSNPIIPLIHQHTSSLELSSPLEQTVQVPAPPIVHIPGNMQHPISAQYYGVPYDMHLQHQQHRYQIPQHQHQHQHQDYPVYYIPQQVVSYPSQQHRYQESARQIVAPLPKQAIAWSSEDDVLLRHLKEQKKMGWKEISDYFPRRTPNACQFRWRRIVAGIATPRPLVSFPDLETKRLGKIRRRNYI